MKTVYLENFHNVSTCSETPLALTIFHLGFAESWATPAIMQLHMTIPHTLEDFKVTEQSESVNFSGAYLLCTVHKGVAVPVLPPSDEVKGGADYDYVRARMWRRHRLWCAVSGDS